MTYNQAAILTVYFIVFLYGWVYITSRWIKDHIHNVDSKSDEFWMALLGFLVSLCWPVLGSIYVTWKAIVYLAKLYNKFNEWMNKMWCSCPNCGRSGSVEGYGNVRQCRACRHVWTVGGEDE